MKAIRNCLLFILPFFIERQRIIILISLAFLLKIVIINFVS